MKNFTKSGISLIGLRGSAGPGLPFVRQRQRVHTVRQHPPLVAHVTLSPVVMVTAAPLGLHSDDASERSTNLAPVHIGLLCKFFGFVRNSFAGFYLILRLVCLGRLRRRWLCSSEVTVTKSTGGILIQLRSRIYATLESGKACKRRGVQSNKYGT